MLPAERISMGGQDTEPLIVKRDGKDPIVIAKTYPAGGTFERRKSKKSTPAMAEYGGFLALYATTKVVEVLEDPNSTVEEKEAAMATLAGPVDPREGYEDAEGLLRPTDPRGATLYREIPANLATVHIEDVARNTYAFKELTPNTRPYQLLEEN